MKGRIRSTDDETRSIKKNSSNSCLPRKKRKRKSLLISCLMLGMAAQMPAVFASELSNVNNNNDNGSNDQNTSTEVVSLHKTDANTDADTHKDVIKGEAPSAIDVTGTPAKGSPAKASSPGSPIVSRSKTITNTNREQVYDEQNLVRNTKSKAKPTVISPNRMPVIDEQNVSGNDINNGRIKHIPISLTSSSSTDTSSSSSSTTTGSTTTAATAAAAATSTSASNGRNRRDRSSNTGNQQRYNNFLKWCQTALGIQSLVRIQDFDYIDHMQEWKYQQQEHPDSHENSKRNGETTQDSPPMQNIRGLAAIRNIDIGEILISVPYHALLTLHTTIDHDPVLSQILGPEQRLKHGWTLHQTVANRNTKAGNDGKEINESTSYYEIALLIVAVLYHVSLGRLSPLWFYIDTLVDAPKEQMPFLWSEEKIREEFSLANMDVGGRFVEVMKLAKGIKQDVRGMYDGIMDVLVIQHEDIFAPFVGEDGEIDEEGWAFSYDRFEWAFAMVNSRHWHLPLQDLDAAILELRRIREDPDPAVVSSVDDMNTMPANQPTDEYISLQDEALKMENIEEYVAPSSVPLSEKNVVTKHSFMAPLADMLNFGPPCARGQYNTEKKAFEVVATCSFQTGQEVTFWYSDDCEDVMISNYGFTHPMVPRCPTIEDWKYRANTWKNYAENLENTLNDAYEDLYESLQELKGCSCDDNRMRDPAPAVVKAADNDRENLKYVKKTKDREEEKTQEIHTQTHARVKQQPKQSNEGNSHGRIRRTKRNAEEERDDVGL